MAGSSNPEGTPVKKSIAALLALSALPAVSAVPLPAKPAVTVVPARYSVLMTMFEAKGVTTSPRLVARATEPATLRTGNGKQIFEMIVTPTADGLYLVRSNLVQWTPAGLVTSGAVTEAGADGKPRCITLNKRDAKTGKAVPIHVDVVINKAA
jgi:hypothetical protein